MSHIIISCPKTHLPVQTSFKDSPVELEKHWDEHAKIKCPHCGDVHKFVVRQAFVDGVLSDQGLSHRGISDLIKELEPKSAAVPPQAVPTQNQVKARRGPAKGRQKTKTPPS